MASAYRSLAVGLLMSFLIGSAAASASKYRWRKGTISLAISTSITSNGSNISPNADVNVLIDRSISSWQQAAAILLKRSTSAEQSVSPPGNQGDGISLLTIAGTPENLALFPKGLEDATARTRVFYDSRGFITEADIVLNPYLQFSVDGTPGTFDLESTLTHELGHLLGLYHSPVLSSTMSDDLGRNGLYSLPSFSARTLASDDIAAIRSLYGPADKEDECCGRIIGRITLANGKPASGFTVWGEFAGAGRVAAATTVQSDGSFRMGGLPTGKIKLYVQSADDEVQTPADDVGEVTVTAKQTEVISERLERYSADLRLDYLGLNGQLSQTAVPVNAGSSYFLLLGSTGLEVNGTRVESSSDLLTVEPRTYPGTYGNGVRTLGFQVSISSDTPAGEYSLLIRNEAGSRRYLIGGITVEKFPNFWSSAASK